MTDVEVTTAVFTVAELRVIEVNIHVNQAGLLLMAVSGDAHDGVGLMTVMMTTKMKVRGASALVEITQMMKKTKVIQRKLRSDLVVRKNLIMRKTLKRRKIRRKKVSSRKT